MTFTEELELDLELALLHLKCLSHLLQGNEYEKFTISHLTPVKIELQRQLTNLRHSAKLNK